MSDVETMIYDLDSCILNERNGTYGGNAGDKEGVTINDEYWIVKYPKTTRGMRGELPSYTSAPLSEYIGSHVYKILGIDAHETILGIRNSKLVVACKDFCKKEGSLREIRTLKNVYNRELSQMLEERFSSTSAYAVDLDELLLHLDYNPILKEIPNIKERFWEMFIVDIFINNNDRNNGNWGALYEDGTYRLAPVFGNGAAFSTKLTDRKLAEFLSNEESMLTSILNGTTAYETEGKNIRAKNILIMENEGLLRTAYKVVPMIHNKMYNIKRFIQSIPETKDNITVCSEVRKQFYVKAMELRLKHFLMPIYEKCLNM